MIPVFKPYYDQREIDAVAEVIKTGWTGLGPKTEEFEKKFSEEYCNGLHVCGVNSCTSALDLALKLIGVGKGDQVLVPVNTFVSTAHVVKYNLADPVFVDVDETTLNMNLDDMANKITNSTKAIIPVHFAGRPIDLDLLFDLAQNARKRDQDIFIVEDCAHSCGAYYKNMPLPLGDYGCFSFHAVKNLSMGEGGALVAWEEDQIARAKRLRWLGIDKSTWDRNKIDQKYWWEYDVNEIGLKCNMDDIHAAMGIIQLEKLKGANEKRRRLVQYYRELLNDLTMDHTLRIPPETDIEEGTISSWHLLHVFADKRDKLSVFLMNNGISTGVHYKPISNYDCYGNKVKLEVADEVCDYILTLPLYPDLKYEEVEYICDKIHEFYSK